MTVIISSATWFKIQALQKYVFIIIALIPINVTMDGYLLAKVFFLVQITYTARVKVIEKIVVARKPFNCKQDIQFLEKACYY